MVNLIFPVTIPQEFLLFYSEKDQYEACEFSKIRILSEPHRRTTIIDCVNLLKQTVKSWCSPHKVIRDEINMCVFNVFQKMGIKEKMESIEYFTSVIRLERVIDDHLMSCFVGVVRGMFSVYDKYMRNSIEMWQELKDFFKVSSKFVQKLTKIVELFKGNELCGDMFDVAMEIAKIHCDKTNEIIEDFQNSILNFSEVILRKCDKSISWYDKIRVFFRRKIQDIFN